MFLSEGGEKIDAMEKLQKTRGWGTKKKKTNTSISSAILAE